MMRNLTGLALAMLAVLNADAATHYDFRYEATGHPLVTPVQVFDDGGKTWVQMKRPEPPPAFFAVTSAGQALITPTRSTDGQFFIFDRVERQIMIALGSVRATVRYTGEGRADAPALFGAAKAAQVTGAPPAAQAAEKILASRRAKPAPKVAPEPVPTPAEPEERRDLGKADPQSKAEADVPPPEPPLPTWTHAAGGGLRETLAGWTATGGWHLVWEASADVTIPIALTYRGAVDVAIEALIKDLNASGHPYYVHLYEGSRVARVTFGAPANP